jgi:hypothetical protein
MKPEIAADRLPVAANRLPLVPIIFISLGGRAKTKQKITCRFFLLTEDNTWFRQMMN